MNVCCDSRIQAIDTYKVPKEVSIRTAVKKMYEGKIGFVVSVDESEDVIGVLTEGDLHRAILSGINLENKIIEIANRDFFSLQSGYAEKEAKDIFQNTESRCIPILEDKKLISILTRREFFKAGEKIALKKPQLDMSVVIMAGGKGVRLDPFTRILPKALIPIGDKPVMEIIMNGFAEYGMKDFYVLLNHKARMIKVYFEDIGKKYNISYIDEDKPLGTVGALGFLGSKMRSPFIVINCDTIIEEDYDKIYDFHKRGDYILTMVACLQHHTIPYGVCKIEHGGELKEMTEKPEQDFLINTGMYIFDPEVLKFIPYNQSFDITELIKILKENKKRIGVYPISERLWKDLGQWDEYKKTIEKFHLFG